MKIVSWNVNGLRAAERKGFAAWLERSDADLILLQETKANEDQLPDSVREPEGWHAAFHSGVRKGYSGVGLYSRAKPDEICFGMGVERFDVEGRVIAARYGKLHVIGAYFPNGADDLARVPYKLDFYAAMLEHVNKLRKKGREVVVAGDWNTAHREIDLARPKENVGTTGFLPEERAWVDRFVEAGWLDSFRILQPTATNVYSWWSFRSAARERNVGWRIDCIFIDAALRARVKSATVEMAVEGSDHCPVTLELTA